jgi:hypothetical protein
MTAWPSTFNQVAIPPIAPPSRHLLLRRFHWCFDPGITSLTYFTTELLPFLCLRRLSRLSECSVRTVSLLPAFLFPFEENIFHLILWIKATRTKVLTATCILLSTNTPWSPLTEVSSQQLSLNYSTQWHFVHSDICIKFKYFCNNPSELPEYKIPYSTPQYTANLGMHRNRNSPVTRSSYCPQSANIRGDTNAPLRAITMSDAARTILLPPATHGFLEYSVVKILTPIKQF